MKVLEKIKRKINKMSMEEHIFEKWSAIIVTTNGKTSQCNFNWGKADVLSCSVPKYILIGKKFFIDEDGVMYPVQNIESIEWRLKERKVFEIPYVNPFDMKVFYTDEELGIDNVEGVL